MKPVIVSIFSLLLPALVHAQCQPLAKTTGAATFWKLFTSEYGEAPFPESLKVCTGRAYFFEIKGGAKMQSVLDRKNSRILRRSGKLTLLMHELAHVYLDLRWKVLPYSVSEPLVLAMAEHEKCPAHEVKSFAPMQKRWQARATLSRCELLDLLTNILNADAPVRDSLPLK